MTETIKSDWCVYDLENDTVVGVWKDYSDAHAFWSETLASDDSNWAVFPAIEVSVEALKEADALGEE